MECKYQDCDYRFKAIEKMVETNSKEIEKLKENKEQTNIDIALLCQNLENVCTEMKELTQKLDKLTNKDGQSWDKAKWIVITSVITAILAFLLGKVGL